LLDKNSELVSLLCDAANSVTETDSEPYTLSGGTYAHKLPNAYVFGTNANLPPDDFPKGKGGAHGIDEAVSLDRLKRAMKIYARAMLALNDIRW
jgi:succinyl-diaminopimelate desuccinylase